MLRTAVKEVCKCVLDERRVEYVSRRGQGGAPHAWGRRHRRNCDGDGCRRLAGLLCVPYACGGPCAEDSNRRQRRRGAAQRGGPRQGGEAAAGSDHAGGGALYRQLEPALPGEYAEDQERRPVRGGPGGQGPGPPGQGAGPLHRGAEDAAQRQADSDLRDGAVHGGGVPRH